MRAATLAGPNVPSSDELAEALLDPSVFINEHCRIRPATGGRAIPFKLWPSQKPVLEGFLTHRLLIVLKARQLGLSWLALAYALWLANCNRGQTVLIMNRNQDAAKELLQRIKFMHARLPPWLRAEVTVDNATELHFGHMDSRILSLPTTEFSGSGLTATLVILDEWAKLSWTEELWASLEPTISAGGQLIGISTAVGYHNQFARMWRAAVDHLSNLHPIFLPWSAHPSRDDEWYEQQRQSYLAVGREQTGLRLLKREYPATPEEAFQTTGLEVFGDEWHRMAHVIGGDQIPAGTEQWPVFRGIDFGYHHSPCLWARVEQDRTIVVFGELAAERMTTQELGKEIVRIEKDDFSLDSSKIRSGVDPSGKAVSSSSSSQTERSDVLILRAVGVKCEWGRMSPEDRVKQIKQLLREGRLVFHNSCTRTIEAMERAVWATTSKADGRPKDTYAKDGLYDHYLDALGYMIQVIWPTKPKSAGRRGRKYTKRHEYAATDGSEF